MGHIDSLTVMSADGASDIVKNATRAMIESTTAIKGLTGLDVPNLVGGALGRGFGERLRTGGAVGDGEGADTKSAADRIGEIAGGGLSALRAQAAEAAARAETTAKEAAAKAAEEAKEAAAEAKHISEAVEKAGAVTETRAAPAVAKVTPNDGNVQQWAKWLADQLRRLPDIQVYDALRLSDLAQRGPAPARAVWATAQAVLGKDFGNTTIGDLLKRFET
jgi:hypothetical protein